MVKKIEQLKDVMQNAVYPKTIDSAIYVGDGTLTLDKKLDELGKDIEFVKNSATNIQIVGGPRILVFGEDGICKNVFIPYSAKVTANNEVVTADSYTWTCGGLLYGTSSDPTFTPSVENYSKVDTWVQVDVIVNGVSLSQRIQLELSQAGVNGKDAYDISLMNNNGLLFKFNEHGESIGIDNTTITCKTVNIDNPTFQWRKAGIIDTSNTTNSYILNSSDMLNNNSVTLTCEVKGIANDLDIVITDSVCITKTVDGTSNVSVVILSTQGNIFKNGLISTTLFARVYRGTVDITDSIDANYFTWTRVSNDSNGDVKWNNAHFGGCKSINVTKEDVIAKATFDCDVTINN